MTRCEQGLGISNKDPHTHTQKNLIKRMDECLDIIMIFNFFFKKWYQGYIKKIESIITINFFNMGHWFGVTEKWGRTEGKLKFGFAEGRVQTFVLSVLICWWIPSP